MRGRITHLKKAEMATAAEELLAGTDWVPEPLRTPWQSFAPGNETQAVASAESSTPSRVDGSEQAVAETADDPPRAVAAE